MFNNLPKRLRTDDDGREQFVREPETVLFAQAYSSGVLV